jgi:hypothetical protein
VRSWQNNLKNKGIVDNKKALGFKRETAFKSQQQKC